jgi:hypothetical protein
LKKASLLLVLTLILTPVRIGAVVYSTREQALARVFPPPATVERRTFFPTPEQRERATRLAGSKVEASLIVAYVGKRGEERLGTAYFDTHPVRTLNETILVVVSPDGTLGPVEVVAFGEPEDYLPRASWLRLFAKRRLGPDLSVGRGLAHVSGATLTTQAIAAAVRRVLALHAVLGSP